MDTPARPPYGVGWPESPVRGPRSPFRPRQPLRHLYVTVDVDVLDDAAGDPWSPQRQLAGLLQHPLLQVIRYADDGPPADAPAYEATHGTPKARGWVTRADGFERC